MIHFVGKVLENVLMANNSTQTVRYFTNIMLNERIFCLQSINKNTLMVSLLQCKKIRTFEKLSTSFPARLLVTNNNASFIG